MRARVIPSILAIVATATLSAGCSKKESPTGAPTEVQSPTAASSSSDVATSSGAGAKAEAATSKAMQHFGDKPYKVCDQGHQDVHSAAGIKGRHLALGDAVQLSEHGPHLQLTLGQDIIDVKASAEGAHLVGKGTFKHDLIVANATRPEAASPVIIEHEVHVEQSPHYHPPAPPNAGCEKAEGQTIIAIEFCPPDGAGGFTCNQPRFSPAFAVTQQ